MSELVDKAAAILQEAAESMRKITDEFVDRGEGGLAEANLAYRSTASLQVFASQMSGEKKVYEGPCEVDNGRDLVSIDGFEVRDNIQFEILYEGKWIKGHRYHSQYGQAFSSSDQGHESFIITNDYIGRVTFPLTMDEYGY